jgi:hypothetical protein
MTDNRLRKYYPCIWTASEIVDQSQSDSAGLEDGRWVPARAIKWRQRWRATWLVWTGQADAVVCEGGQTWKIRNVDDILAYLNERPAPLPAPDWVMEGCDG